MIHDITKTKSLCVHPAAISYAEHEQNLAAATKISTSGFLKHKPVTSTSGGPAVASTWLHLPWNDCESARVGQTHTTKDRTTGTRLPELFVHYHPIMTIHDRP